MERITNINEVYYGKEPVSTEQNNIVNLLNWYRKNSSLGERKEWFIQWLKENFPGEEIFVENVPKSYFSICGMLARIYIRGLKEDDLLNKLIDAFSELKTIKSVQTDTTTNVVKRNHDDKRLSSMLVSLETKIDDFINSNYNDSFDMEMWKKEYTPTSFHVSEIKRKYSRLLSELKLSFDDAYYQEAYSHMTVPQKKRFVNFITSIVEIQSKRKTYKKRKDVKIEKRVKNVKVLSSSSEFNINSMKPENVFGSKGVMTFNNKYRIVNYLLSKANGQLSIKGTTIQDFDEETSFAKRVRKPKDVLPALLKSNLNTALKILNELSTQTIPPTGRLGDNTLILKIF